MHIIPEQRYPSTLLDRVSTSTVSGLPLLSITHALLCHCISCIRTRWPTSTIQLRYWALQKHKQYTFHQFEIPLITDKKTQPSELAVLDQDVERTSVTVTSSVLLGDPFQLSDGIVPDEQIASLRHRKKGKRVAKYQLRQNNVCVARACSYLK
jgi:hypothetical protein